MSQTLKEAIATLPLKMSCVKGGKTANRCYIALNEAIEKVIAELQKLDVKLPSPIEFI
jgi:predicted RNase H-like HicB family nuclease